MFASGQGRGVTAAIPPVTFDGTSPPNPIADTVKHVFPLADIFVNTAAPFAKACNRREQLIE
ncbi:hypothetical protein, partial [Staphylococcus aureus]